MTVATPVAFFIFNRPGVTRRVFEVIAQAQPATLLVVADGPRSSEERAKCEEARAIIAEVNWPCRVITEYAETNLGCKKRLSSGLSWVFSHCAEAIILEDDCVPDLSFFPFCEQMLDRYRDDVRVMMVTGTNYLLDKLDVPESYVFSRYYCVWGWATWRRAWAHYDIALAAWEKQKADRQLAGFYSEPFMQASVGTGFDLVRQGKIDTWDIQWSYSCLFQSGLCIVPRVNLISNIGAVGHHSAAADRNHFKPVFRLDTDRLIHPAQMFPDQRYDGPFFAQQFQPPPVPLWRRVAGAVKRRILNVSRSRHGH